MIICVCHRVSDRDIARVAHAGCTSFDELQFELGVATQCGKCHDCAREAFGAHSADAAAGINRAASPVTAGAPRECPGLRALAAAPALAT